MRPDRYFRATGAASVTDIEIQTVTSSLERLIAGVMPTASVTTAPPDVARTASSGEQINLFLFGIRFSPGVRNAPREAPAVTPADRDVAMVLDYLLTAYGAGDDDLSAQRLLGRTMSLLYDRPVLGPPEIFEPAGGSAPRSRIEHIDIALRTGDMPALWNSFGFGAYRLSIACEASVVFRTRS